MFFPTHAGVGSPDARNGGRLVLDGEGCIRVDNGDGRGFTPIWPPDHRASAEGRGVRILDGEGRVLARVGDEVELGGGYVGDVRRISGVDRRTARELVRRCPGDYFYAGPGLRAIRQGRASRSAAPRLREHCPERRRYDWS